MTKSPVRNLDHIVLPVPDLDVSRARFTQLGFSVAPDGKHKFGTENACVLFKNGSFIEPVTIGQRETVEAAIRKGNNFLRRDAAFRFRNGENGFWGLVFSSDDSKEDRKVFRRAGYQTGKLIQVRRKGLHARVAFAIDERAPDFSVFVCQYINRSSTSNPDLMNHANGANAISRVVLHEHLPEDFQYYLQKTSGQREVRSHSFGMEMKLPNSSISILNADGVKAYYGIEDISRRRGLRAMAFDVSVDDLSMTEKLLDKNGIATTKIGRRLIVQPANGQGSIIAFVEG